MSPESRRLRLAGFAFERLAGSRCRAEVRLQHPDGREVAGEGMDVGDAPAELRCAAQAAVHALEQAVGDTDTFELLGVKAVRAFDTVVIIVALSARHGDRVQRLVGSYLATEEPQKGAAVAVLSATNRFLGNTIFAR